VSSSSPSGSRQRLTLVQPEQKVPQTRHERLSELYRQHAPMVFRLALRYFGDRSRAEDLTQEVFLVAYDHDETLAQVDNPAAWLYRVTTRRCLNQLRNQKLREAAPFRWAAASHQTRATTPEELGIHRQALARLFAQLEELPPKMRICFWMYHVDGKTQPEIGEILGHSKGYINKLLKRALARLEEEVSDV
jgi:RNA polymerase sigma-70 factor (ECF subfamily)